MKCGMWSVKCGDCEVWRLRSAQCGVLSVKCGMWRVKCGVWSLECEVILGSALCKLCSTK